MRTVAFISILFGIQQGALAQAALPKVGTCPSGFYSSGKYCIPIKDDDKPAMLRSGTCPTGYYTSGKYCVAERKESAPAVPKNGPCPTGFYSSGSYCLKHERQNNGQPAR